MSKKIYLDYNSTTPVDPEVLEAMLPYFTEKFGNAASRTHSFGWIAEEAVEIAREQVAAMISSEKNEIVFTSGATESINLALKGVFEAYHLKGKHILTVVTEHKAVLDTCKRLESLGAMITYLPVGHDGSINLKQLEQNISDRTILVCVMMANNETGLIHPMQEISKIVHSKNSILMSDATQACGKIKVNVNEEGIDLLALSAHKLYGPKGAGALYIRRRGPRVQLIAQQDGGGHENGRRSGTLNVPGIVGLGKACEICMKILGPEQERLQKLKDTLEQNLLSIAKIRIHAATKERLPNTSNILFEGIRADKMIKSLNTLALSTGSACTSALPEASHVLKAMGMNDEQAHSSVRFSLGRYTVLEDIDIASQVIKKFILNHE
jgi:cysteine desulfurase